MQISFKHRHIFFEKGLLPIDLEQLSSLEETFATCEIAEELGFSREELFIIQKRINRA